MNKAADMLEETLFELRKVLDFLQKGEINDVNLLKANIVSTSIMALRSASTMNHVSDISLEVAAKTQMFELFMARYFANSLNTKNEFESFSQDCLRMAKASEGTEKYEATERSLARLDEIWQLIESSRIHDSAQESYS